MKYIFGLSILILLTACKTKQAVTMTEEQISTMEVGPDDIVFMLKKSGCFGTCPVFTLRIYSNNYAEYIGKQHTGTKTGVFGKMLPKEQVKELKTAFDDAAFFTYENNYESDIPDLPSIKISYHKGDMKKTITGKRERPEAIHKLQFKLEMIADSQSGWIKAEPKTIEKKEPTIDKTKIVVDIAQGNSLARWLSDMKDKFGVQILERLSDNNDSWLLTFDHREHKAENVLLYMQGSPVTKSAEFLRIHPNN